MEESSEKTAAASTPEAASQTPPEAAKPAETPKAESRNPFTKAAVKDEPEGSPKGESEKGGGETKAEEKPAETPKPSDAEKEAEKKKSEADRRGRETKVKDLKRQNNELRRKLAEIEAAYKKAGEEKNEYLQKMLEYDHGKITKEISEAQAVENAERFFAEAEGNVKNIDAYMDAVAYYAPKFADNQALNNAIGKTSNPHGVMEHLLSYMDQNHIHPDAVNKMDERQIAITIAGIDEMLKSPPAEPPKNEPPKEAKKEVPPPIVAKTAGDLSIPELGLNVDRKTAILHYRKHGINGVKYE